MTPVTSLPATFYFVLLELLLGTSAIVALTDAQRVVPRGFFRFMGGSMVLVMLVALWARGLLSESARAAATFGGLAPLVGLALLVVYAIFAYREEFEVRLVAALAATAALTFALVGDLHGYQASADAPLPGASTFVSFSLAALVLGSAMAGMLLGHWYLVAPLLTSAPLLRVSAVLTVALLVQAATIWNALMGEGQSAAWTELGPLVWIRLVFGLALPGLMMGFVLYSCRIRAMRTATGILYLVVGATLMGDVVAKMAYFLSGEPL